MDARTNKLIRLVVPRVVRTWLRSPRKTLRWLGESVASPFFIRTEAITDGRSYRCDPHLRRVVRAVLEDRDQADEIDAFCSQCSPGMRLFDVGAHFGMFSLLAASCGAQVLAVEPSPMAVAVLRRNIDANRYRERIAVLPSAASSSSGRIPMVSTGPFSDGYLAFDDTKPGSEQSYVDAVTVDQMTKQFWSPTHIKIDVEGFEEEVLRGAAETLAKFSPFLFLELHNEKIRARSGDPAAVIDILRQLGYATDTMDPFAKPIVRFTAVHTMSAAR